MTTLNVHLEEDGSLSYKPEIKGARWRGDFKTMPEISDDADKAGIPEGREINYVMNKDDA